MTTQSPVEAPAGLRADARRNRDRVLQAAMRHFELHGISASLEEIARQAGVGAGTLYRHFPTREALLEAALGDRKSEVLDVACEARKIGDADAALAHWLEALQKYLRSFNGLSAPVLAAVKEQKSPLSLSCEMLVSITGEFLERAQKHGHARATVTASDLFMCAIGMAWVLNRAEACGTSTDALNAIVAHGYLEAAGKSRP